VGRIFDWTRSRRNRSCNPSVTCVGSGDVGRPSAAGDIERGGDIKNENEYKPPALRITNNQYTPTTEKQSERTRWSSSNSFDSSWWAASFLKNLFKKTNRYLFIYFGVLLISKNQKHQKLYIGPIVWNEKKFVW